jgi:hypothetical protein
MACNVCCPLFYLSALVCIFLAQVLVLFVGYIRVVFCELFMYVPLYTTFAVSIMWLMFLYVHFVFPVGCA